MSKGRWAIALFGALICGGLVWAVFQYQHHPEPVVPEETEPPWFVDVTDEVGLDFVHDVGPVGTYFLPEHLGSGAAFFDFDNDGRLDILLLQYAGPKSTSTNRLYRQLPEGKFKDVSKGSGLDITGYNMGVAIGDVNNDGFLDVLITQYSGVKLFLNNGDGTFRDATEEAGLNLPAWGVSAAFFDFDRDGWLDLVVVCYVDYHPDLPCPDLNGQPEYCGPKSFKGRVSRLYRNLGRIAGDKNKGVRFEDVTVKSGLGHVPGPGLGVVCADFDGDGWPDIFIANDGEPNRLWINRHDDKGNWLGFTNEAVKRGVAYNMYGDALAGMGVAYGDVDGDGLLDIFVTHLGEESHTLWKQSPRGFFMDKTTQPGLLRSHGTGFGTLFGDFTNAGHLDLAIVNGAVKAQTQAGDPALGPFWRKYGQRNQLYAGDGRGSFRDISKHNAAFCGKDNVGRGVAQGDINGDGGLDLLVTAVGARARLFRNVAKSRGHWLSIRAFDPALNRDALGAAIKVFTQDRSWVRSLHPAESFLCSSEPRAHFGLGTAASVDRIEVTWPDGEKEVFPGCPADRRIELRKGETKRAKQ